MKKTHLFCTKIWFFLSEIPIIALLIISIICNDESTGLVKLYPLIIFSVVAIILVFLYFFRMIVISTEEIKCIGVFSSKDSAIIKKDKALIFTLLPKNKIVVRLYGKSDAPGYNWSNDDEAPCEIDLFREKAVGGASSVKKVLAYFGVPSEDIAKAMNDGNFEKEYTDYIVSKTTEENKTTYNIKFKNTI